MAKERRTINVSLQSKKYLEPVNQILNEWEDESLNLSTQICENLLLVKRLKSSITFGSVLAVYELIERVMKVYDIKDKSQLEKMFAEVISIDHAKLGEMVTKLTPELSVTKPEIAKPIIEEPVKIVSEQKQEVKPENKQDNDNGDNEDDDTTIPMDFLLNG